MLKLNKDQMSLSATLVVALQEKWAALEAALADYNSALTEAREFATEIAEAARSYFDEKSEKWQEGETGQAYDAWAQTWEDVDGELEEIEIDGSAVGYFEDLESAP